MSFSETSANIGSRQLFTSIGADPVVLAVGGDEGAVESDVAALHGGHEFEFRRGEVFFFDAVGVFQEFHDRFFRRFSFVGVRADDGLELFAGDAVGEGLFHLVLRHVDEQVGDVENGVVVFEADIDIDFFSVFREDDAAQGEGRAGPLVFLDAPVVVGAEVDDAVLFVDGIGFQVEAGRVDVGADDLDAGGISLSDSSRLCPPLSVRSFHRGGGIPVLRPGR